VAHELTKLGETVTHGHTVGAVVTGGTFRALVIDMVSCWLGKRIIPLEATNWLLILQEVDCLLNCCSTFVSAQSNLAWLVVTSTAESGQHLLKIRNHPLGVRAHFARDSDNVLVDAVTTGLLLLWGWLWLLGASLLSWHIALIRG